ncbi:MAG: hypothetical protein J5545_02810 [Bacteroidaceae bacterium]|nr:hypothetical protein [Bacteroidaceae bacterium]
MKKIATIFCLLLGIIGSTRATSAPAAAVTDEAVSNDFLSADTLFIGAGDQANLNIKLTNAGTNYTAYQFLLTLPTGVEVAKDNEGHYIGTLSARNASDASLTVTRQAPGRYMVVCYSPTVAAISGSSGALLSVTLHADESLKGQELEGQISDVLFSDTEGEKVSLASSSFVIDVVFPVITILNATREYGDANPTFTYTVTGAVLNGEPALSSSATASSPVGDYDITAARGTITNAYYEAENGTLTVTKAPLTITVASAAKKQGDPLPSFQITYSGFKNGESTTVLTSLPTVTCGATAASPAGTYPITVSGAAAQNYEITYVNGTLTVVDADAVVVTANSYSREYGEENPDFGYTSAGATLEGTPAISCEATVTSPVGEYPIVITKGSVTNYNDSYVNGTLTITKAPLTITVASAAKKQGDPMPEFQIIYSGFKNGETEAVLTTPPTVTCEATAGSPAGSYPVIVSGAAAQNYEITYVNGTLTVNDADAVVVTANSYTREYGDPNPDFGFTSEGATLEGTPAISCEATVTSPVGEYPIVITKGSVTNYNDSYVNGTLTITKAPLTITVQSVSKQQGEENPEFEIIYSGFKNSEGDHALTTMPTVSCAATADSPAGSYPIIVSGAVADNYEITYVNGTLTILEPDAVVVTAFNYSREYGEANPDFDYASEGSELVGTPSITCAATADSPVGTYPIVVAQGSITNDVVTLVNGTLTITPAPLTITVQSATKQEGDPLPEFQVTYSGFKNGETEAVLTTPPTVTCEATADSPAGSYPITIGGAEAQNYNISYVSGTLTVTPATTPEEPIVITANSYTMEYGDPLPTFGFTTEGAAISGIPAITCEAVQGSPVGTYPIIITQGTVTNTDVTLVNGTLTITPAPLTITATDDQRVYGDETPADIQYAGFKNEEDHSVLTTQPSVQCEGRNVGTWPITVDGAEAQNYEITCVNGTRTITPATLIVGLAGTYSRYEGEENPAFELSYSGWLYDDNASVLTAVPTASTEADMMSTPGDYPVTISGGAAANYTFVYIDGTLTVNVLPSYMIPYNGMVMYITNVQNHEVQFIRTEYVEHLVIPATVTFREQTWRVTAVADSALYNHPELVTVSIPATVTTVGTNVFSRCTHLAAITWEAPVKMTSTMMGNVNNPNLLFYMSDTANALDGATNVIDNNTKRAARIVLSDASSRNDFYCPTAFTADEISYTHRYAQQTQDGTCRGWEALVLPFNVTSINHNVKGAITPFGSLELGHELEGGARPFWLYQFTTAGRFSEAAEIRANIPYIISMPNESNLSDYYILKGDVTFSATNATVQETATAVGVASGDHRFTPNYRHETLQDAYLLNVGESFENHVEGSVFAQLPNRTARPFEAYFDLGPDAGVKSCFQVFDETDGIKPPSVSPQGGRTPFLLEGGDALYDLSGRRVGNTPTKAGIYIRNGKKQVLK